MNSSTKGHEVPNQIARRLPPSRVAACELVGSWSREAQALLQSPELPLKRRNFHWVRGGSAGAFALPAFGLTSWLPVFVVTISAFHASAADRFLLKPAVVHTVSGASITKGSVLIEGDKIIAGGATVSADGATVVELPG